MNMTKIHFNFKMKVRNLKPVMIIMLLSYEGICAQSLCTDIDKHPLTERRATSVGNIKINGNCINYTVTSEDIPIKNDDNQIIGAIYSFSYIKKEGDKNRPVTFLFNGGPGSSSLWLHMGLGPKKVVMNSDVNPKNIPPFEYQENPDSILDCTDLVFVDPVGTGYSRILGAGKPTDFYGVEQDAESLAQFIERWLIKHNRWNAPKYLIGESYGSARITLLAKTLTGGPLYSGKLRGITINGMVMLGTDIGYIKSVQNVETQVERFVGELPSLAATAWYHQKAGKNLTLNSFYTEAKEFADTEYKEILKVVLNKRSISPKKKAYIISKLTYFTGLDKLFFKDEFYITKERFTSSIIPDIQVGLYDSRYTLSSIQHHVKDPVANDPAMSQYTPVFIGSFNQYLKNDLLIHIEDPYQVITWKNLSFNWDYKRNNISEKYRFADDLSDAMSVNKYMKILIASGYYDLVTPGSSAFNVIHSSSVDQKRIKFKSYESGHMLYIGKTGKEFSNDIRDLIVEVK
ncbi:S10 family peptidase [Chryseobacterium sp. S90]|uniref:S10 family peptidase n=1 Tax=Chryseobacterium sp. S90 TaxID=3395373 RepID=UPI0039BD6C14